MSEILDVEKNKENEVVDDEKEEKKLKNVFRNIRKNEKKED